jgi:hypothetical protein
LINIIEVRDPFRIRIADSGIFNSDSIAWENENFNPSGKSLWLKESLLPVDESFLTPDYDLLETILSFQVNTPIGDNTGDSAEATCVNAAVALGSLFQTAEVIKTDNYTISVDKTQMSFQGNLDDRWYSVVVDITIRAYE